MNAEGTVEGGLGSGDLRESTIAFDCAGTRAFGIVAEGAALGALGVVVVVGGPQYRVGSHRQFVRLARHLGRAGYPTLRFDYRGLGDTPGPPGHFERAAPDIGAAVDALLRERPRLRGVVLWGLCDGASAALLYLAEFRDPRVAAAVLVNPWVRTAQSHARTQLRHYYLERLGQRQFWAKMMRGELAADALRGALVRLMRAVRAPPEAAPAYTALMARGWGRLPQAPLLVLSDSDYTAREFEAFCAADPGWQRALRALPPRRCELRDADHTCSRPSSESELFEATLRYLGDVEAKA